jgi:hypothetical protein
MRIARSQVVVVVAPVVPVQSCGSVARVGSANRPWAVTLHENGSPYGPSDQTEHSMRCDCAARLCGCFRFSPTSAG